MAIPVHHITCTKKEEIARDVYDIRFSKPDGFAFKPGQFVLFDVPLVENAEDIQTRAFSLASTPAESELIVVAKMKEGGRASRWIEEILEVGTPVAMKGPFGNFKLDTQTDKDYLFVATSTGVGPFRPMILEALERGDTRRMDLIFGVRNEEDLFGRRSSKRCRRSTRTSSFISPSADRVHHGLDTRAACKHSCRTWQKNFSIRTSTCAVART